MFERFTGSARHAVVLAQNESRDFGHNYIGTEHLLLGLLGEKHGVAAEALTNLGFIAEHIREQIEAIIGRGVAAERSTPIPFTARTKTVIIQAVREGLQLGHRGVSTEHLLLAIIREGEGVAAQIISRTVNLSDVKREVIETLSRRRDDLPTQLPEQRISVTISHVPMSQLGALWDALAAILPEAVPTFQISTRETG